MQAAVVGAGRSGRAAARLLRRLGAQVRLLERDPGNIPEDFAQWLDSEGCEVMDGEHCPAHFEGVSLIVPSPGVPVAALRPHAPEGAEIIAEMELSSRECANLPGGRDGAETMIAVTGTNGKSTTVTLTADMLRAEGREVFLGGNIGTPLSEYVLDRIDGGVTADVLVLEVSSFQLQTCNTFGPRIAAVLNFSANHLDYHADMREYLDAKLRIFACQQAGDLALLPLAQRDFLLEHEADTAVHSELLWFDPVQRFTGPALPGPHNRANIEAAWQMCSFLGVSEQAAAKAVAEFRSLRHRMEYAATARGVLFFNDSKATTVEAVRAALGSFDAPVRLLAGGKFKGGDLASLIPLLKENAAAVGLFGGSRELFEKAWKSGLEGTVPMTWDETLEAAMRRQFEAANVGDVIILSPATSSFDQYRNFEQRGDDFVRVARILSGENGK